MIPPHLDIEFHPTTAARRLLTPRRWMARIWEILAFEIFLITLQTAAVEANNESLNGGLLDYWVRGMGGWKSERIWRSRENNKTKEREERRERERASRILRHFHNIKHRAKLWWRIWIEIGVLYAPYICARELWWHKFLPKFIAKQCLDRVEWRMR